MTQQLSMFDLWTPPIAIMIEPCDPFGAVIQGAADVTLTLPRKGNVNPIAEIELHQHTDGRWMWSTEHTLSNGSGGSYRVGPKWGRFAATKPDALSAAVNELIERVGKRDRCKDIPAIIAWARGLAVQPTHNAIENRI